MFILVNNVNTGTVALNPYRIEMNTELLELILGKPQRLAMDKELG